MSQQRVPCGSSETPLGADSSGTRGAPGSAGVAVTLQDLAAGQRQGECSGSEAELSGTLLSETHSVHSGSHVPSPETEYKEDRERSPKDFLLDVHPSVSSGLGQMTETSPSCLKAETVGLEDQRLQDLERLSGETFGSQQGYHKELGVNKEEEEVEESGMESSVRLLVQEDNMEQECPICTELYDTGHHKRSLLNCNHSACDNCIKTIMDKAGQAEVGRVKCPICRQKTPILKWEIQKLQDQMMETRIHQTQPVTAPPTQPIRGSGLCAALEFRFQQRFQTRMCPFPPCLRYPVCFINGLRSLERHCRCLYLAVLVILVGVESMCFLLLLLPILVLVLFILFAN